MLKWPMLCKMLERTPAQILAAAQVANSKLRVSLECFGGASRKAMGKLAMLSSKPANPIARKQVEAAVISPRRTVSKEIRAVSGNKIDPISSGVRSGRPRNQSPAGSARKNVATNRCEVSAAISGSLSPLSLRNKLSIRNCAVMMRLIKNCPHAKSHTRLGSFR